MTLEVHVNWQLLKQESCWPMSLNISFPNLAGGRVKGEICSSKKIQVFECALYSLLGSCGNSMFLFMQIRYYARNCNIYIFYPFVCFQSAPKVQDISCQRYKVISNKPRHVNSLHVTAQWLNNRQSHGTNNIGFDQISPSARPPMSSGNEITMSHHHIACSDVFSEHVYLIDGVGQDGAQRKYAGRLGSN